MAGISSPLGLSASRLLPLHSTTSEPLRTPAIQCILRYGAILIDDKTRARQPGGVSAIGSRICRELAGRGYPLLLVSNRDAELEAAAREIAVSYGVDACPIKMDLARPEAARALYEEVTSRGLEVEILVSNAGMFFFGEVADADPARVETMMQLHVVTPSLLAHFFGQDMRARRSGHILFTSSISAWRDFPGIAYYGSSKTFLRSFACALREELSVWGSTNLSRPYGAVARLQPI